MKLKLYYIYFFILERYISLFLIFYLIYYLNFGVNIKKIKNNYKLILNHAT